MAGELITEPWQVELNGLLMGATSAYVVAGFDPWSAPQIRPSDAPRPRRHGIYVGRDWLSERMVELQLRINAATDALEQAARRALAGAWKPSTDGLTVPLVWMEDDAVEYVLYGAARGADTDLLPRLPTVCRFVAADPRIYRLTTRSITAGLPVVAGGLAFPAAAPFVFGSAGGGGDLDATNDGTIETPWVATFTGPLVAPQLTHATQAKTLAFTGELAAGETLVVDSSEQTVLLNGTASRYSWLTAMSAWWTLEPGANPLQFAAASGTGTVNVTYRDAYL
jgi:hypothetical protein